MKALKYILLLLLILIIGFAVYIAVQPNSFYVKRTATINAPQAVAYNYIIDFKNWEAWSSWKEENPNTKISLSDKTKGVGGSYSWQDDDGSGTMTTVATDPVSSISQEMQFEDMPKSDVTWNLKSNNDGTTEISWSIKGDDLPFDFKIFSTLMGGMEKQIGPHFERGLTLLDSALQAEMKVYSIDIKGETQHSGGFYLYKTVSCKLTDYQSVMQKELPKVGDYAKANNVVFAGSPFILYEKWDEVNNAVIFSTCIPTNSKIISNDPEILTGQLDAFKAVKTVLKGDYSNLKEAWDKTMSYIETNSLEIKDSGPMLEAYVAKPSEVPNPADWLTEIYIAIK